MNGFFNVTVRLINVTQSALLQSLGGGIVFFTRYVIVSLIDEVQRLVQTPAPIQVCVHGSMVVQILAVIDRGLLDFIDRVVDFVDGVLFLLP